MDIERVCIVCGAPFLVKQHQIKRGRGKCCSLSCAASLSAEKRISDGSSNGNWKGGFDNSQRVSRYRKSHPERYYAHLIMRNAIRRGELTRGVCEVCGDHNTEGHHDDYSAPLTIRWLCKNHHFEHHKKLRQAQPPLTY